MPIEWQLSNTITYVQIHSFGFPEAFTYADTRPNHTDKDKREWIRAKAAEKFPQNIPNVKWWAFRIYVKKSRNRPFDIENVPKLIVDAFCKKQIQADKSHYTSLGLYDDDTIDFVRIIEVGGERTSNEDATKVDIFGCR